MSSFDRGAGGFTLNNVFLRIGNTGNTIHEVRFRALDTMMRG